MKALEEAISAAAVPRNIWEEVDFIFSVVGVSGWYWGRREWKVKVMWVVKGRGRWEGEAARLLSKRNTESRIEPRHVWVTSLGVPPHAEQRRSQSHQAFPGTFCCCGDWRLATSSSRKIILRTHVGRAVSQQRDTPCAFLGISPPPPSRYDLYCLVCTVAGGPFPSSVKTRPSVHRRPNRRSLAA